MAILDVNQSFLSRPKLEIAFLIIDVIILLNIYNRIVIIRPCLPASTEY